MGYMGQPVSPPFFFSHLSSLLLFLIGHLPPSFPPFSSLLLIPAVYFFLSFHPSHTRGLRDLCSRNLEPSKLNKITKISLTLNVNNSSVITPNHALFALVHSDEYYKNTPRKQTLHNTTWQSAKVNTLRRRAFS